MAHHAPPRLTDADTRPIGARGWPAYWLCLLVGTVALAAAVLIGLLAGAADGQGLRRFGFAYVTAYAYVLSIALGALFFVLVMNLFRAGWSVLLRRIPEAMAASMPTLAALFLPILLLMSFGGGSIYLWADPAVQAGHHEQAPHEPVHSSTPHGDGAATLVAVPPAPHPHPSPAIYRVADAPRELGPEEPHPFTGRDAAHADVQEGVASIFDYQEHLHLIQELVSAKQPYLTTWFFTLRWVLYLGIWITLGGLYWRWSTRQDVDGDPRRTRWAEMLAAPGTLLFALTLTFAAFDLIMSLDPVWFSTIFGVYYFAGCALSIIATLILVFLGLQRLGFVPAISVEHYHDLGKLMFAFVFFWGYIAFSQYMLIWYANLPEETYWFDVRGLTTHYEAVPGVWGWSVVGLILLFGHLLIPFAGLLSRHVKRNMKALAFWAVWLLAMHYLDLYWLIWPVLGMDSGVDYLILIDPLLAALTLLGVGGLFAAAVLRNLAGRPLVPIGDPRLDESLAFKNL